MLKRPEVVIEHIAPVLRVLMAGFFEREEVDSGRWPVAGEEASSFEFQVSSEEADNSEPPAASNSTDSVVILSAASATSEVQVPLPEPGSIGEGRGPSTRPAGSLRMTTKEQLETRNSELEPQPATGHRPPATDFRLSAEIRNELKAIETEIKYSGYLDQQTKAIERLKKSEQRAIPDWFDYAKVSGLSREMNEKLSRVRPRTLGHASRIPGVTPAAVSLINVYIEIQGRQQGKNPTLPPLRVR